MGEPRVFNAHTYRLKSAYLPHVPVALEPLEAFGLIVALLLGLGNAAWSVYLYKRGKQRENLALLRERALIPMSKVAILLSERSAQHELAIPSEGGSITFPPTSVRPSSLPDLARAMDYLRRSQPQTFGGWEALEKSVTSLNEAEGRLKAEVKKRVKAAMGPRFPYLTAQMSRHTLKPDIFVLDVIVERVVAVARSSVVAGRGPEFNLKPPTQETLDGVSVTRIGDGSVHLLVSAARPFDVADYLQVLTGCARDPDVVEAARTLQYAHDGAETCRQAFHKSIAEVIAKIEYQEV